MMLYNAAPKKICKPRRRHCSVPPNILVAVAILFCFTAPVFAASFTISTASTTAQTLGTSSGQTGTVTSAGSLTVSGGTVAVTISGNNETLLNSGTITQTGSGRVIRDNTGVTGLLITNTTGALMQSANADVIQMNVSPASVILNNYGTMTSLNSGKGGAQAVDFSAILSGSNIVNNYSIGIMQAQDADAVRPGVNGQINNYGTIKSTVTTDTGSDGVDAQNNSGVQITNYGTGLIQGSRHGITGGAVDNTVSFTMSITNQTGGTISGTNGAGVNIDGFNANETVTITNQAGAVIKGNGVTGDGDGIDVDGLVNLNNSGTILSVNSFSLTAPAQSEGVTVGGGTIINSGTIEGNVATGNTNAAGRGITFAGIDTSGTAEPIYANSTVTNSGLIKGQNDSAIAVGGSASGFTVTITNQAGGTIEGGGTNAAILTGADNDTINNSGTIKANGTGKAIDLGAGNDMLNISGSSASVTGDISGGSGTNMLTVDPGAGGNFSYAGTISNFNGVEVKSGTVTLSGSSNYTGATKVTGGRLIVSGSLAASVSGTVAGGSTLQVDGAFNLASAISVSGTLKGTGTVGGVSIQNGGTLAPGDIPGILTASSGISFSGSQASLSIVVGKTTAGMAVAGTDYSQMNITGGAITLNHATLSLSGVSANLQANDLLFIILNGGAGAINGTFNGLAEGTIFTGLDTPGVSIQISYTASASGNTFSGTGNDVALKVIAVPEPSIWCSIATGSLFLLTYRRRRYSQRLSVQAVNLFRRI